MSSKKEFKRYTVTSALPYANGPIHIGHLAGVYVPADIYVRYLKLTGKDVLFIGGSDEHGVPITIKARSQNKSPQEVVDYYHTLIKDSFSRFGISFDIYSRTSAKIHHETASAFFKKLYDKGVFIEKTSEQYYDEEAQHFLADRYITGTCPHCHYEKAYGDQCENCGTSLSPDDLINPVSVLSGNKPIKKSTKHWYLPLDRFEPWLSQWILEEHKSDWKPNVYGQCKSWIDSGLQPRAVTRDLDWGVKVPVEGAEGKVLYVWFDAPIGYISAAREWSEKTGKDWEPYWKDDQTRLIHFIGKDNIVFHCIIFPSMLKAEGDYILPDNVPAFEFMNLENEKISTSRNWAVWLHEYLEDFPGKEDVLRYVLTANAPETKDNDFTWKDFQARNNNELLAILGNFVNRTLVLTHKYFEGKIPALGEYTDEDRLLMDRLGEISDRIADNLESFRFRDALAAMMSAARAGNKYLTDSEPWKLFKSDPVRTATILNLSLQICGNLSVWAAPFLPFTAAKLRQLLNLPELKWQDVWNPELLRAGEPINKPEFLFERITDEQITRQVEKLKSTRVANQASEEETEKKEQISYEQFEALDIRIGTVKHAEKVPKTKKLLKLEIDLGFEVRTIVSGIAGAYEPEQLLNKRVVVLINLAPRRIRGIESNGMILSAEDSSGRLSLIMPDSDLPDGSVVK
ncbi:MAG: methionine--tRNA ligase [Bacteroidales bacterium]